MTNPGERGVQSVVVILRDRIELVIMTPRTSQRHAQKRFTGGADDFVQRVGSDLSRLHRILIADVVIGPGHQKRGAHSDIGIVLAKHVARDVFANELVERLVFVDRPDHVIAKRPDVVDDDVPLVADAFSKADDVQPVSSPAFAVVWRRQQAVDQLFISLRIGIA